MPAHVILTRSTCSMQGYRIQQNRRDLDADASNIPYKLHMRKKTGWHHKEWREERVAQAAALGHLCYAGPDRESGLFKNAKVKYCCPHCKWLQKDGGKFVVDKCRTWPHPKRRILRDIRVNQPDVVVELSRLLVGDVSKFVRWTLRPTLPGLGVFRKPSNFPNSLRLRPIKWWRDLTEEGVKPNPGPRCRKASVAALRALLSRNVGAASSACTCLHQASSFGADIVCLAGNQPG